MIKRTGISDTETPLQHTLRLIKEGKLAVSGAKLYRLYDFKSGKWLDKPAEVGTKHPNDYVNYHFRFNGKPVQVSLHRILYAVYHNMDDIPDDLVINHINGVRCDNRKENLELVTQKENIQHSLDTGFKNLENNNTSKLKWKDVDRIRDLFKEGCTDRQLGEMYGVHRDTIRKIRKGKSWVRRAKQYGKQGDSREKLERA